MKKLTLQLTAIFFLAIAISFTSCKKGDTGPAGETGAQGAKGDKGDKGDAGSANVIYSDWMDVTFDPVKDTTNNVVDTLAWLADIDAAQLDASILSTGEIKVYVNVGTADDPAVFPLPLFDYYSLTGVFNINLYFRLNTISLYSTEDASTFTNNGDKLWQYRYVLIPGGTAAGRKSAQAVDWNNYEAVKKYLNLKN